MFSSKRGSAGLLLVTALTLTIHLIYLTFSNGDYFFPDSRTYLRPALQLLQGHGFTGDFGAPETMRTPGYPVFLLPFLAAHWGAASIVLVQHVLDALLAAAIYSLARRRMGTRAATVATLLFACDTATIHMANKVLTETIFTVLLFALVLTALRIDSGFRRSAVVFSAILAGVLVLVRPVAILYFLILALYFSPRVPRTWLWIYLVLAGAFPLTWGLRNAHHTGVFTVSSVAGGNILMYRAAGALAILDDGDFAEDLTGHQIELREEADGEIEDTLHIPDAGELPHAVLTREYARIGRRIVLGHPVAGALLTLRGILVILFDSDSEAMVLVSRVHSSIVEMLLDAWTAIVFALTVTGFVLLWRRDRPLAILCGLTIGYFVLISAGGESEARFRVPVMPLFALAAGAGFEGIVRGWKTTELDSLPEDGPIVG